MSALRGEEPLPQLLLRHTIWFVLVPVLFAHAARAFGQAQINELVQASSSGQDHTNPPAATSLSELLNEAERNNPQIEAARQG